MTVKIQLLGVKETQKMINKISLETTKKLPSSLSKAAIYVQGEVKLSIAGRRTEHKSVDTGRFLNSIGIKKQGKDVIVYSDLPYAKKLEFGTDFKNSPRRHFTNTSKAGDVKAKVKEILSKDIKGVINKNNILQATKI